MSNQTTSRIRDLLAQKVDQARAGDYLALLDLSADATDKDVKDSYFRLARLVHPDSVRKQALQDRKEDAAFVFEKVTEAYQLLLDPARRKAYIEKGAAAVKKEADEGSSRLKEEQAKIALHHGKLLLNRRAYADAEKHFREFTQLKPDEPRGFLFLGWSLFQNQKRPLEERLEEAREAFKRALQLDPASADGNYYMALYHKQRGEYPQEQKFLKKALEIDKKHVPSLREQRLLEMRLKEQPAQPSVGDFLKDLWGKLTKKR